MTIDDLSHENSLIRARNERLESELADMTAQRDWMAMRYDALEAGSAADRLDAQRYRWLRESERGQIGGRSATSIDTAIDAAIATGGQP